MINQIHCHLTSRVMTLKYGVNDVNVVCKPNTIAIRGAIKSLVYYESTLVWPYFRFAHVELSYAVLPLVELLKQSQVRCN